MTVSCHFGEPRDRCRERLDRGLLAAYEAAIFEARLPGGTISFTTTGAPVGVGDQVASRSVTIITAYNPGEMRPGEAANRRANERLRRHLERQGWEHYDARGYSADGSHEEPSFAVRDLAMGEARALGARFQQACVFYWDGQRSSLVWCGSCEC